jgi:dsDNA-specific endonuclease/ATPase MutS2
LEDLIATIDESGIETLEYVCVIIGDYPSIKKNLAKIPSKFTHMTNMPEKEKQPWLESFDFTGNILVCCMNQGL